MSSTASSEQNPELYPELQGTIRWGIVGCGTVCEVKSGPAYYKAPHSSLVAVMRRNAALVEDFAKRHNVPKWYTSARDLIMDPEVDAVYVATPPSTHKEMALLCAELGKPCVVEKPVARSAQEAREMVEAFQKARLPLMVAFYRRHLPKFELVRTIIQGGQLGTTTGITLRYSHPPKRGAPSISKESNGSTKTKDEWRVDAEISGGGLFLDLGSHMLDTLDWLVGPLQDVQGMASRISPCEENSAGDIDLSSSSRFGGLFPPPSKATALTEDNVRIIFRTETGALGVGVWNFVSTVSEDLIQITGSEGTVSFSCFNNEPIVLTSADGEAVEIGGLDCGPHVHLPLVESMSKDLLRWGEERRLNPDTSPELVYCRSTGESALRTAEGMDKALEGYYRGRSDEFWKRPETWQLKPGSEN